MLAMVCWMAVDEPWPISIMAMTAATPMMIPEGREGSPHDVAAKTGQGSVATCGGSQESLRGIPASGVPSQPYASEPADIALEAVPSAFDHPIADPDHAFGGAGDVFIVGDEDDGNAFFLVELLEELQDFFAGAGIEISGGLVGKQQGGMIDQCPGDGDPLLLAAGKLRGFVVEVISKAHPFAAYPSARFRASSAATGIPAHRSAASSRFPGRWCGAAD